MTRVTVGLVALLALLAIGPATAGAKKKALRLPTELEFSRFYGGVNAAQVTFKGGLPDKLGLSLAATARKYEFCLTNRKVQFTLELSSGEIVFLGAALSSKQAEGPTDTGSGYGGFVYEASVPVTGAAATARWNSASTFVTKKIVRRHGRKFICTADSAYESFETCGTQCGRFRKAGSQPTSSSPRRRDHAREH